MFIIQRIFRKVNLIKENKRYHHLAPGCRVQENTVVSVPDNLIMQEGAELEQGALILNINAKFIMGKFSGAGPGLTVIAGNHIPIVGKFLNHITDADKFEVDPLHKQDQDVVLEEDVWLGANVTLLNGVRIGRGAIVSAGSVIRSKIPPYAIVAGNPAKVVGFRFTPQQVIEHESILYQKEDCLPLAKLEKNYKKYYVDRLNEISDFIRI